MNCTTANAEAQGLTIYTERALYELYDDMLNECHELANICGYSYDPAYALKEVDPIAYRCGFADWLAGWYVELDDDSDAYITQDDYDTLTNTDNTDTE